VDLEAFTVRQKAGLDTYQDVEPYASFGVTSRGFDPAKAAIAKRELPRWSPPPCCRAAGPEPGGERDEADSS